MTRPKINLDQIKETAYKGVRRSAAFLGLGVNAARDSNLKKYQLSGLTMIQVISPDLSDEKISHIKEEFEKWIIINGLRELVESFSLFLDRIHTACLVMAISKNKMDVENAREFRKAFKWKGIEEKLSVGRNRFGIKTEKEDYLISINKARNCITHRSGRVGPEDVKNDGVFRLKWWSLDIFIETPTGTIYSIKPPFPSEGLLLKDGGTIKMKINNREVEYSKGEYIQLSPNDLSELCLMFQLATGEIARSTLQYAQGIGIQLVTKDKVEGKLSCE